MKIIFSRKGFDSSAGRAASPILTSGEMYSLPIPEPDADRHTCRYADIQCGTHSCGAMVQNLTQGHIQASHLAHLDPDLNPTSRPRPAGWRPLFGQAGAAERHLQNHGVGPGDVFLFFGWFRAVEYVGQRYRYVAGQPDRHIVFGWLQIAQRMAVAQAHTHLPWATGHPHYHQHPYSALDSLYLSIDRLHLPGLEAKLPGAGLFTQFRPALCLTAPGAQRSQWQLPAWFHPAGRASVLSYHQQLRRWSRQGEAVMLKTVGRGQEFVLDCDVYPEAIDWLVHLFALPPSIG